MVGLRIIGAGLGRTGTTSVKLALEELLGGRCYHMSEVRERPEDSDVWGDAYEGRLPNWEAFFDGYEAAVDWPSAPFWRELSVAFPDAPILLSVRDADAWWKSVSNTIFIALATYFAPDAPGRWLDPHGSGDDDELHPRLAERGSRQKRHFSPTTTTYALRLRPIAWSNGVRAMAGSPSAGLSD